MCLVAAMFPLYQCRFDKCRGHSSDHCGVLNITCTVKDSKAKWNTKGINFFHCLKQKQINKNFEIMFSLHKWHMYAYLHKDESCNWDLVGNTGAAGLWRSKPLEKYIQWTGAGAPPHMRAWAQSRCRREQKSACVQLPWPTEFRLIWVHLWRWDCPDPAAWPTAQEPSFQTPVCISHSILSFRES